MRLLPWALLALGCSSSSPSLPPIPLGLDAYRHLEQWPRLRIGLRAYMRSTYDRNGGNEGADASHFLRQDASGRFVALDVAGPGLLAFVRTNHWHGSPWHYLVDGKDTIVSESSTATPDTPVAGTFLPAELFPAPLALTWSQTQGADLNWVPMGFQNSLSLQYERTHYGTGYYIFQRSSDDIRAWDATPPPADALALLERAGSDLAPANATVQSGSGTSIELSGGPQQIRAVTFTVATVDAAAFGRSHLQITWDDLPLPSVEAPIDLLHGTGSLYNRENREYLVRSLPAVVRFAGDQTLFSLYFPMPFIHHAKIAITGNESIQNPISWQIKTEPYPDPIGWFGYFHATYVDHAQPIAGQDLVLLDTTSAEGGGDWCGHFVGTSFTFSDRAVLTTLEGDPRFFFDDSLSPQGQGTGSEEWGGGGDYWGGHTTTLPLAGHPVGAPSAFEAQTTEDQIESAYRFLLADLMPFGRNARIQLEHGGNDDSVEHYRSVTYWYGRPSACLVPSDTLHVGDSDDEAAHRYRSPDASDPEVVTSHYDWGADSSSDSGRHTMGSSEFSVAIDPSNVGVLLRRKLDQAFADQRAEVFIADDSDGAPYLHAATWYTAGSNVCLYSNPRGELDPPQPIVQTSDRRWLEDELLLPRSLTAGRARIRLRMQFVPGAQPLQPGQAPPQNAWSEFRYTVYSYLPPSSRVN